MKEQLTAGLSEGQIAEFVENDEVHAREMFGELHLLADAGEVMAGGRGLWPLPRRWSARLIGIGLSAAVAGRELRTPPDPFLTSCVREITIPATGGPGVHILEVLHGELTF